MRLIARRRLVVVYVALAFGVLSACGTDSASPHAGPPSTVVTTILDDRDVVGTWREDRQQPGPGALIEVTLSSDGVVRGHDRCNAFFTHWVLASGAIKLDLPAVYNTAGCPEFPDITDPSQPLRPDANAGALTWQSKEGPVVLRRVEQ